MTPLLILALPFLALAAQFKLPTLGNTAANVARDGLTARNNAIVRSAAISAANAQRVRQAISSSSSSNMNLATPWLRAPAGNGCRFIVCSAVRNHACCVGRPRPPLSSTIPRTNTGLSPGLMQSNNKTNDAYYWVLVADRTLAGDEFIALEIESQPMVLAVVSETPMDMLVLTRNLTGYYPDCVVCDATKTECLLYCYIPETTVFYLTGVSQTASFHFNAFEPLTLEAIIEFRADPTSGYNPQYLDEALGRIFGVLSQSRATKLVSSGLLALVPVIMAFLV